MKRNNIQSARELLDLDCHEIPRGTTPVQATEYIGHLRRLIRNAAQGGCTRISVVLHGRVSSGKQGRNGNLDDQLKYLRRRVERIGQKYGVAIDFIDTFGEADVSAWTFTKSERAELVSAAKLAMERNAILVSLNTSRLVRNKRYWQNGTQPTVEDFENLKALVGMVRMATVVSPDKHEDRSADTKRGFAAKDAKPGRPKTKKEGDKKRRRMHYKIRIIQLVKQGLGNREIGRQLDLPEKTVRDWRKRYRKYWVRQLSANAADK